MNEIRNDLKDILAFAVAIITVFIVAVIIASVLFGLVMAAYWAIQSELAIVRVFGDLIFLMTGLIVFSGSIVLIEH